MTPGGAGPMALRGADGARFGLLAWPQATDWPSLRESALAAEAAGWDSVWVWDHLMAIIGRDDQPIFEGWTSIAAIAALTSRVRVGLMVGANTFRNPGLTAKLATTLDHVSGGRAVVGLGGAWFEREHDALGIDFGASVGARLDWLDEAVGLIRRLLDGEVVTHDGPRYHLREALCRPLPVQAHLPILVGGSGPRKTLRTVAAHADAWNTSGQLEDVAAKVKTLDEHCAAIGRDPAAIERTISFPIVLRDDATAAEHAWQRLIRANGAEDAGDVPHLLGSPEAAAEAIRPYLELGFSTVICRMPAPYDAETIERIGEVAAHLGR
ncbi:MAG TPA: LLM class flavin-dependent oxidoreductase [Candidatus Limnocylindrales bacterium]|nr:LLM class flavin-dependent oxidoreductase [Candidatus Limnocylindrales bacterium]